MLFSDVFLLVLQVVFHVIQVAFSQRLEFSRRLVLRVVIHFRLSAADGLGLQNFNVVRSILLDVCLFLLNFTEDLVIEELVVVVVEYVVLVLVDDVHGAQHIQGVVHPPLHVFEVNSLSFLHKVNYFYKIHIPITRVSVK